MGIPERKLRERATMKKLILDAANDLYSQKGLDFITIRKIAEKIDYSPATIYLYYPSKNLIFYDLQKLAFESLLSSLQFANGDKNAFTRLSNFGRTYIDFGITNPEKYDLMFLFDSPMNAIDLNAPWGNFQQTLQFMQTVINDCIKEKSVIYMDPLSGSLQFWAFLHGVTSLYLKGRLTHYCGTKKQNSNAVNWAWDQYMESVRFATGRR